MHKQNPTTTKNKQGEVFGIKPPVSTTHPQSKKALPNPSQSTKDPQNPRLKSKTKSQTQHTKSHCATNPRESYPSVLYYTNPRNPSYTSPHPAHQSTSTTQALKKSKHTQNHYAPKHRNCPKPKETYIISTLHGSQNTQVLTRYTQANPATQESKTLKNTLNHYIPKAQSLPLPNPRHLYYTNPKSVKIHRLALFVPQQPQLPQESKTPTHPYTTRHTQSPEITPPKPKVLYYINPTRNPKLTVIPSRNTQSQAPPGSLTYSP